MTLPVCRNIQQEMKILFCTSMNFSAHVIIFYKRIFFSGSIFELEYFLSHYSRIYFIFIFLYVYVQNIGDYIQKNACSVINFPYRFAHSYLLKTAYMTSILLTLMNGDCCIYSATANVNKLY